MSDRRERRGRVTNATRGMHLVRFEWQYCTSTSVIARSVSVANIDKKRVLSIPTNFSFQTLGPDFSRNIYPKIYTIVYIYSLFSTKRPTFFRNQSRPGLNYRRPLRISLLLPKFFFEIWRIVRSEEGKRKNRVFPRSGKSPGQQTRSLVRDIFTPRRAISARGDAS